VGDPAVMEGEVWEDISGQPHSPAATLQWKWLTRMW